MKLLRAFIISGVLLAGAFGAGYCAETLLADFESGSNPVNIGGNAWCQDGAGYGGYESGIRYPMSLSGYSLKLGWTFDADNWGGGGISDMDVSVATSAVLSFWIYTPNTNTDLNVQLQDTSNNCSKLQLQDYLITGTSIWQNCMIPVSDFRLGLPALNISNIKEVKWIAELSMGNDSTGVIYVDNVKFLVLEHTPANMWLKSGGDRGTADSADRPGDTLIVWDQADSSATPNTVIVTVSTGYACSWVSNPADAGTLPGTTAYFAYRIRNDGNFTDSITFSSAVVQGSTWPFAFYWDKDKSGTFSSGDTRCDDTVGLVPNSTHYFLVAVNIPSGTVLWSSSTIRVTARDNGGSGANDSWLTGANDDTITDEFLAVASNTVSGTLITVARSSATASGTDRPGDTITFTIHYPNVGDTAGAGMIITEVLPFNAVFNADPGNGDADSNQFYVGGAWQDGYNAAATKVRWLNASVPAASNSSVSYTIKVKNTGNASEETVADWDNGQNAPYWGGYSWGGGAAGSGGVGEISSIANHSLTPGASSWKLLWTKMDAVDTWAGGGIAGFAIDVSTYDAVSFWMYTPNANTNVTVQIQDQDAFGNDMGKVRLRDYLITQANVWQNVIIPLEAFRRNLTPYPTAPQEYDLKIKEVKLVAEYSMGSDSSGLIYLDDIKFLKTQGAPAGSVIVSGSDKGALTVCDMPGDSFAVWDGQSSSTTFSQMSVKVSTGYAEAWGSVPADSSTAAGFSVYFPYKIINNGNSSDKIHISTSYVQGCSTWPVTVYWDSDKNGAYSAADQSCWALPAIEPNCTGYFLVGVGIPAGTVLGSSSTIRVTARDNGGSGVNDSWPAGTDDDTITDEFVAVTSNTIQGAYITNITRSSTTIDVNANGRQFEPGDRITFAISYDNLGDTAGTNMIMTEAVPSGTTLLSASGGDSIQYYVGSAWQAGFDAAATRIKWIDASVPPGTYTLGYTVTIKNTGNASEEAVADYDNGTGTPYWGGYSWGGGAAGSGGAGELTTITAHSLLPGASSWKLLWTKMDAVDNWAGGGVAGFAVDVSTYDALSFWMYTPNANTNVNVQIQDQDAYGGDTGKVQLQDYLVTGTSVWQNVIIPLEAFRRNLTPYPTAPQEYDLKIKEVKLVSEFSMGNDPAGIIYLDDIKFLKTRPAPAGSALVSGSDKGALTVCDMPGDSFVIWDGQASSTTFSQMSGKVTKCYAAAFNAAQSTQSITSAGDYYFAGKLKNEGNFGDDISLTVSTVTGSNYVCGILWDRDGNGAYTAGTDVAVSTAMGLQPNCTFNFLVKVTVPSGYTAGQSTILRVTAKTNSGSGASDNWPVNGTDDDTIRKDDFVMSVPLNYAVEFTHKAVDTILNMVPDTTAYYEYTVRNAGNVADVFSLSVATTAGNAWDVWLTSDTNKNSHKDDGEETVVSENIPLAPGASFFFFISVYVPPDATGNCTAMVTVKDQNGLATVDDGDDIRTDSVQTRSTLDSTAPDITLVTVPPERICMLGNKIVFRALVSDSESAVSSVKLTHWINAEAKVVTTLSSTSTVYTVDFNPLLTGNCSAQYYLEAVNEWGYTSYSSTGVFYVSRITSSSGFNDGTLKVEDGNPDDGATSIYVPAGALSSPINLVIEQILRTDPDVPPSNEPANSALPSTVYDFKPAAGGEIIFSKPVTLTLLYLDTNKDGTEDTSQKDERYMRVFWWDGYEWRLLGGKVDAANNTVEVKVMHLSRYAVFPIRTLTAADYRTKERVLTPFKADGKNDRCQFGVSGTEIKINIYDVNGAKVRELKDGVNMWDCKDENGELVESGVYIYQIKMTDETVSGTVLVVK